MQAPLAQQDQLRQDGIVECKQNVHKACWLACCHRWVSKRVQASSLKKLRIAGLQCTKHGRCGAACSRCKRILSLVHLVAGALRDTSVHVHLEIEGGQGLPMHCLALCLKVTGEA